MTRKKIRKLGLGSSFAAFVAFGLIVVADNRNLGFGCGFTRRNQLGLLAAAITLSILQVILYLTTQGKEGNAKTDKQS